MTLPEIEVTWGGDRWRRVDKKHVRPIARCALGLANYGMEHLAISYEEPKKAKLMRVVNTCPIVGECSASDVFNLCIPVAGLKRRKAEMLTSILTSASVHELIHAVQLESKDEGEFRPDLISRCADEGVAHIAQAIIGAELGFDQFARGFLSYVKTIPPKTIKNALQGFLVDADYGATLEDEECSDEALDKWFVDTDGIPVPIGVILGSRLVLDQMEQSTMTLADTLRQEPEETLGLWL